MENANFTKYYRNDRRDNSSAGGISSHTGEIDIISGVTEQYGNYLTHTSTMPHRYPRVRNCEYRLCGCVGRSNGKPCVFFAAYRRAFRRNLTRRTKVFGYPAVRLNRRFSKSGFFKCGITRRISYLIFRRAYCKIYAVLYSAKRQGSAEGGGIKYEGSVKQKRRHRKSYQRNKRHDQKRRIVLVRDRRQVGQRQIVGIRQA